MKTDDQTITTDIQNLNEALRLQKMLSKERHNPDVNFLNKKTFQIKLDTDLFFTVKMNDQKEYKIDAIYRGEERVEDAPEDWMNLMHFLTAVEKIESRYESSKGN